MTLAGLGIPLVMGAFSIPLIVEKLGVIRFGVLTLIWAVYGYFSLFDFGIGKALTKRVAEVGRDAEMAAQATKAGLSLLLCLGVGSGIILWVSYPLILSAGVIVDSAENFRSLMWLATGMPLLLVSIGLRGILEGQGNFVAPAAARIAMGISTFGFPVPLLAYRPSLEVVVVGLVAGRLITVLTQGWACRNLLLAAYRVRRNKSETKYLLSFGGWMMGSNLISPLMVFADRFVVAASPIAAQLAYYTTPFELVTRLLIIPAAVTTVFFPKMSELLALGQREAALKLMLKGMGAMLLGLLPLTLLGSFCAEYFLGWWLGPDFAVFGKLPMILLCWGVLFNSLAAFPFSYLQSAGKVRQLAFLHLAEFPVYFVALPWFLARWGITGVAVAWLVRVTLDCFALCWMTFLDRRKPLKG